MKGISTVSPKTSGEEERGLNPALVKSLSKTKSTKRFSKEYDTVGNKLLWYFFRALVPKDRRTN